MLRNFLAKDLSFYPNGTLVKIKKNPDPIYSQHITILMIYVSNSNLIKPVLCYLAVFT